MKNILTLVFLFSSILSLYAQNSYFLKEGVIKYEKTINMYAILKRKAASSKSLNIEAAYKRYVQEQPQFLKMSSTLSFKGSQTNYQPNKNQQANGVSVFGEDPRYGLNNIVWTDFDVKKVSIKKSILNEVLNIKDSIRNITWKLTDETREIAGYPCKRANGLMLDSLYVVAFYCEKIPLMGGPEQFQGLPGMILGLALPHENITWFATKISAGEVKKEVLTPKADTNFIDFVQSENFIRDMLSRQSMFQPGDFKWFIL